VRIVLLLSVVLGGCAADTPAEPPQPIKVIDPRLDITVVSSGTQEDPPMDVCGLAAALPREDICSLVCDPSAMAVQLINDGNTPGTCYELSCALTDTDHVLVGVCLPP